MPPSYRQYPTFDPYRLPALYGARQPVDTMSRYYELEEMEAKAQAAEDARSDREKIEAAAQQAYDPTTGDVNLEPVMQALWETGNYKEAMDLYNAMSKTEDADIRAFPTSSDIVRIGKNGEIEVLRPGKAKASKPPAYKEETWTDPNTNEFTSFDANSPEAPRLRSKARAKGWYQGRPKSASGGFEYPGMDKYFKKAPPARRLDLAESETPAPITTTTQSQKTGLPATKPKQQKTAPVSKKQKENQKVNILRGVTNW